MRTATTLAQSPGLPAGVTIRPLTPHDRAMLQFVFGRLSPESRYRRFLTAKPELSGADLDALTAVDHWHHEALIAFSPPPRAPIAVARYVRGDEFDVGELGVVVVDQWQGRGVGRALTHALRERALGAGVRRFSATTLRTNRGALAVARALGPVSARRGYGDELELVGRWD